jgi:hypothetical protein
MGNDKSILQGFFGFVGTGVNLGPLGGGQLGVAGNSDWVGLYVEGHAGLSAGGIGLYMRTSCVKEN